MLVQWTTQSSKCPEVRWGLQSGQYTYEAKGSSLTYIKDDLCGGPANAEGWLDPGLLHRALMTDLKAGQRYYYIYGDEVQSADGLHSPALCLKWHMHGANFGGSGEMEAEPSQLVKSS